jgi:hypothetical protein
MHAIVCHIRTHNHMSATPETRDMIFSTECVIYAHAFLTTQEIASHNYRLTLSDVFCTHAQEQACKVRLHNRRQHLAAAQRAAR